MNMLADPYHKHSSYSSGSYNAQLGYLQLCHDVKNALKPKL